MEGHGREQIFGDVDLSRTLGWFTTLYPMVLTAGGIADPAAALAVVQEELGRVANRGIGFGLLRYLGGEPRLRALPQAEVSFNYLGQLDQGIPASTPFALAKESAGPAQSTRARRRHLIDVTCQILERRLSCELSYGENLHRPDTIESLAGGFLAALRAILSHSAAGATAYAPSDFPLMDLSQEELDDLFDDEDGLLRNRQ
jgi:non-ribosomal peptide synthase protein (TIGR01720 family)